MVWSLPRMTPFMNRQVLALAECFPADVTVIWFLPGMGPHMHNQMLPSVKGFATFLTHEVFYACVNSFVQPETPVVGKSLAADVAKICFVVATLQMNDQLFRGLVCHPTNIAITLVLVSFDVLHQRADILESLATQMTKTASLFICSRTFVLWHCCSALLIINPDTSSLQYLSNLFYWCGLFSFAYDLCLIVVHVLTLGCRAVRRNWLHFVRRFCFRLILLAFHNFRRRKNYFLCLTDITKFLLLFFYLRHLKVRLNQAVAPVVTVCICAGLRGSRDLSAQAEVRLPWCWGSWSFLGQWSITFISMFHPAAGQWRLYSYKRDRSKSYPAEIHCIIELQLLMHSHVCHFKGAPCSLGILSWLNKLNKPKMFRQKVFRRIRILSQWVKRPRSYWIGCVRGEIWLSVKSSTARNVLPESVYEPFRPFGVYWYLFIVISFCGSRVQVKGRKLDSVNDWRLDLR